MNIVIIVSVGLVAGLLASTLVRGGGFGLLGDIAVGVVGALLGSWAFRELGWDPPFTGLASAITVASIGAVIVLVVLRWARRATVRP
jgi:uncharacterized membrane protein YeaQ/YmgE (transglycosylase-associated protein family)